ncbi:MAG: UDP-N-acetylmuramoyl-tripeptide--D-alanyl-D-alanine ligase [Thermodesulfovibrionales bacterium]
MGSITLEEIIRATGGRELSAGPDTFAGVSIDSRTIRQGEFFVALRGENFDGHAFVGAALRTGYGALVSDPGASLPAGRTVVLVQDTLRALQDLARHRRGRRDVPVIGVVGTNGKTTTKEMIAAIFSQKRKVLKTAGNLNNHIGLPLCLCRMDGDEDVMVLEMGSSVRGDISLLCEIAKPAYAVATNVGHAHLEGFGSLEAVRDTDLEILPYVRAAVVNADDRFLCEGVKGFSGRLIRYGLEQPADATARDIVLHERGSSFTLALPGREPFGGRLRVPGRFNVSNAVAAAAVAAEAGASSEEIAAGLAGFSGVAMRLEIREARGGMVISDHYNANPLSMAAALRELVRLKRDRMIAVLGDMLELGPYAKDEHRKLVESLNAAGVAVLIAVGPEMAAASAHFRGERLEAADSRAAGALLDGIFRSGDTVLIKGSRGMKMEHAIPADAKVAPGEGSHAV